MSSPCTQEEALYNIAALPGMDQTVSLVMQIINEFVPKVKVCKVRWAEVSERCCDLLYEFRDKVSEDMLKGAEYAKAEDIVSKALERAHKKTRKWSERGRFRSWLSRRTAKKDIGSVNEVLNKCFEDLQPLNTQDVPIITRPSRSNTANTVLDISNVLDLSETMHSLQTALQRSSVDLVEQNRYQRQLRYIYRETQMLPPLADLTGQVVKTSKEPTSYGRYNDVYIGIWLKDIKVALKFARAVNCTETARRRFMKEVEIWRDLQHPHVSRLLGIVTFGLRLFSVSIWMENQDALRYINSTVEIIDRLRILRDVSSGMEYLHFRKVVHGDLRAANILIDENGSACVSDFGLSTVVQGDDPSVLQTEFGDTPVRWQARELVKPDDYGGHVPISFQTDVWSFGMLCLEIMTGEKPYKTCRRAANVIENLVAKRLPERPSGDVVISRGLDDGLWEFMLSCWRWEPLERPSMIEIHGWFKTRKPGDCNNAEAHSPPQKGPMEHLQKLLSELAELNLTSQDIEIKGIKALGGYSDVLNGCWTLSSNGEKMDIAIKRLRINLQKDLNFARKIAREIRIWSRLHHENILLFRGFIMEYDVYPSLVTEWMDDGTVMEFVKSHPGVDILPLVKGIASGLAYLHRMSVVHGDVKSANIMMSKEGIPLIMDFGVSHLLQSTSTVETATTATKGSIRWMAIELFKGAIDQGDNVNEGSLVHTTYSDTWAFGMTVYELLSRNLPYHTIKADVQVMCAIIDNKLPESPAETQAWNQRLKRIWEICNKCWSRIPTSRPSMNNLLNQIQQIS